MSHPRADVAIVGAGILGLAHAYIAAKAGKSVVVLERSPRAAGASVRNFGMVWPIGQPAGTMLALSLRSRELWLEILGLAKLPYRETGSLHVAYRPDEAAVAQEFAELAPKLGYECSWLKPCEVLERSHAVQPDGLAGGLWSNTELTVDPRQVIQSLPRFLAERYNVQFVFGTAVTAIEPPLLHTGCGQRQAETVILSAALRGEWSDPLQAANDAHRPAAQWMAARPFARGRAHTALLSRFSSLLHASGPPPAHR
jgi:FAD dependent oxidoreductase TIGR03364